jgi:hypothetical protein
MYVIRNDTDWERFCLLHGKRKNEKDRDIYEMADVHELLKLIAKADVISDVDYQGMDDYPISFFYLWFDVLEELKPGQGYSPKAIPPEFYLKGDGPEMNYTQFSKLVKQGEALLEKCRKRAKRSDTALQLIGVPNYDSFLKIVRLFYVSSSLYHGEHRR